MVAMKAIDPATGEVLKEYANTTADELESRVDRAHRAFLAWRETDFAHRATRMRAAAKILRERAGSLAELMACEMGKPVRDGRSEAEKCAWVCDYYADESERFLADERVETDASTSYVAFRPLGTVLAIMPWNFPFWQVFRFAAPSLMAGNAALLKHASNVPGCALAIERVLDDAGFPEGLFATLLIGSDVVPRLLADDRVAAATLTGSVKAGRAVSEVAGKHLKKTVLELGGSDPYVVLDDADLDSAVEACVKSRLINSGQSCIAAKRFIVVDAVLESFERRFVERMSEARLGDPMDERTDVGPQAREDLRDELHDQVRRTVDAGARLLLGGEVPDREGAWYPPTVLADVRPGMAAFDEETFGPVAALVRAKDEDDAIALANRSRFGLGAAVFTRDPARGERIARDRLEAGACFVNGLVKSDPRLPFGGIKESGYGRELGRLGIRELVNAKTVWVK